jgi:hypothetical protein
MATAKQLKALRKKHHLGEFRRSRKVYKHHRRNFSMARKRRYHSRRSSGMGGNSIWGQVIGIGGYVLFEQYLEQYIPLSEPILSISELAVSYMLSKKSGIVGNFGKAGVYINAYQIMKLFANQLPSIGTNKLTYTTTNSDMYGF